MAAIYMPPWPYEVTTTLYPVDVTDSMEVTITFADGSMILIPNSDATLNFGAVDGTYEQVRWFFSDGPYDSDDATLDFEATDGSYTQVRWFYEDGPYDSDDATIDFGATDGSLVNKLVEADTPDESLQLGCVIDNSCSMELI